jgi:type I restriction enzyme S subunit
MDNNLMAFIPNKEIDIFFIKYCFDIIRLSVFVQVGALPSYNASDLSSIKILLPPLPEQKAIAEILSTADEEIALLKRKLNALKLQKRSLMQKLLSGEWSTAFINIFGEIE